MILLQGVLDRSLDNFFCMRGYANLGDLYDISKPDPSYQRPLITGHTEGLKAFLDDGEYSFFPEVILGASLDNKELEYDQVVGKFTHEFNIAKASRYSFSQFKLNYVVTKKASKEDSRETLLYRRATLTINNLDGLNKFHRIDGNHRLGILDNDSENPLSVNKNQYFRNLNIPFCLVLFISDEDLKKHSPVLFHNINYKQIPLSMEQNLKLILENEKFFSDEKLLENLGAEYLLARKALKGLDMGYISNITRVMDPQDVSQITKRTFLLKTFDNLIKNKKISPEPKLGKWVHEAVEDFQGKLSAINQHYGHDDMKNQKNSGLLSAFCHYAYEGSCKLAIFKNWVIENHIYQSEEIAAQEVIKIFDCVLESKKRTIFVSMPFCREAKKNYKAISDAVDEINRTYPLYLKLNITRVDELDKSHSYDINKQLQILINDCGFLIADISLGNKNVYHEIGYLMGLNNERNQHGDNFILIHNKGVSGAKLQNDLGFNINPLSVLRVTDTNELRIQIQKKIKLHYKLD